MTSYIYKLLMAVTILIILTGCESENISEISLEKAVVQGYLYANAPVTDISLSQLIPYGLDVSSVAPVNDLAITITHENKDYPLSISPGDSGYYHYAGDDLIIKEGNTYKLNFEYGGNAVSATTTVPTPPTGLSLSDSIIYIEQVVFGQGFPGGGGMTRPDPIELIWDNAKGFYHYVVVENIENNPAEIFVDIPFERNFRFVTEPTADLLYLIQTQILEQYGTHRVVVYRVNQEYVDLFENAEQDSRNLNEPLTNVENGLGIFTAFNSDTLYFEVKQL